MGSFCARSAAVEPKAPLPAADSSSSSPEPAPAAPAVQPMPQRKALPLLHGVAGGADALAVVSFPGIHQDEWNEMVAFVELLKYADQAQAFFSTACIFLPDGDADFGQHAENDVDRDGRCFCHRLYGEPKPWGCRWFAVWKEKVKEVLDKGQEPVVIYKRSETDLYDPPPWASFPVAFDPTRKGLGASQAGEVAYLKTLRPDFRKMDVDELTREIRRKAFLKMDQLFRGPEGGQRLSDAILQCHAAKVGLQELKLANSGLGDDGVIALAPALPALGSLRRLNLRMSGVGDGGARALARVLPGLEALEDLELYCNKIGDPGALELAEMLPQVPGLQNLRMQANPMGDSAKQCLKDAWRQHHANGAGLYV